MDPHALPASCNKGFYTVQSTPDTLWVVTLQPFCLWPTQGHSTEGGGTLTGENGRGKKTRARKNSWPLPWEQNKLDETQSRGLQVFIFQTFPPSLAHSTVLLAQMVTKPVMVQKLHCYRGQTKAEVYFLKKKIKIKKNIVRNGWKSAQGMWQKLCQVVVPALCAADICASNAETSPRIAPCEDSTVLEAPFHRTTPTAIWRRLLSGEVAYLLCSQTSLDTLGSPTPPVPQHCPSEKQRGLFLCPRTSSSTTQHSTASAKEP